MIIEAAIISYLTSCGLSVGSNVFAEVPEEPPASYVLIEKTGSGRANRIDSAVVAVQSIVKRDEAAGGTLLIALELNEEVKAAMENFVAQDSIFSCYLNSDYNFTNPETKEYRYQAVYNIYF